MPGTDLDLLQDAALAAGEIAKRHFREDPEVWDKGGDLGPVTEADLEIDRMLRNELVGARPGYGWLSEETEDDLDRLNRDRVFIVDPIDGTRAFMAGHEHFAHSLAIAERGEIIAAVVHLPMMDRTYVAAKGAGATLNGERITAKDSDDVAAAVFLANKANMRPEMWANGVPPCRRSFRPSLAYRVCLAAEGRYDGMLTLRPTWEWDVAAGDLIAREAGAVVTDRARLATRYNNERPQLNGLLVAGPKMHAAVMGFGPR